MLPDGRGGPHAFVTDTDEPELSEGDRHHLANVLRLRTGDALTVSDGQGIWRPCTFGAVLEPCGDPHHVPRAAREVAVGFALIKGGRPEVVVQKLTELGVDRIVLLNAERSIVRWDPDKDGTRWFVSVGLPEKPRCSPPGSTACARGARIGRHVGIGARCGHGRTRRVPLDAACSMLLVGPEGGWTSHELGSRQGVGLGPTILRSETAAIAAGVLLTALREKMA